MVPRILQNYNQVDGITAGGGAAQVGNIFFKQGRLSKLVFVYADGSGAPVDIRTVIGDITLYKNKKQFRTHTAAQIDFLNSLNNPPGTTFYSYQTVGAGAAMIQYLTVYFWEPWRKDVRDAESQCLIVDPSQGFDYSGLWVQVKLLLQIPATGSLTARLYYDNFIPNTGGVQQTCKLVYRDVINVTGVQNDYKALNKSGKLQTISLTNPSGGGGTIKSALLKVNNATWVDNIPLQDMIAHLTGSGVSVPAIAQAAGAFQYIIVADDTDPVNAALSLAGSVDPVLSIFYTAASAGNITILTEFEDIIPS